MAPISIRLFKSSGDTLGGRPPSNVVRAGVEETLDCEAWGSRPAPSLTWWRDGQQMTGHTQEVGIDFAAYKILENFFSSSFHKILVHPKLQTIM